MGDDETIGRRDLLKAAIGTPLAGLIAGCSVDEEALPPAVPLVTPTPVPPTPTEEAAALAGSWPIGTVADVRAENEASGGFAYRPELRAWLVAYPETHLATALETYPAPVRPGLEVGILALHQKCPHLGCRVPECKASGQFECPCHGSKFTPYGEHISGPSPRGLDLLPVSLQDGQVVIDNGAIVTGLDHGTDITGWQALGPNCIGEAGG